MTFTEEFTQALRNQRLLMKRRPDRLRFRLLIYLIWTLGFGTFFSVFAGVQARNLGTLAWWSEQVPSNMLMSLCVTVCFFFGYRGLELLAPQRWLDAIISWRDWRSGLFFSTLSICLALLGVIIGIYIIDLIWGIDRPVPTILSSAGFWRQFFIVSAIISVVLTLRYRARWKQEVLQARVTEAQLKLLQGQIEPHFLFNTLANVQSLIDFDPDRAKLMLERFTDYLRASLGQLRGDTTTLAQEFAMLEAYLALMQLRMGERLQVTLDLPAALRDVELPPLLAQPLVENAIHHGLEPKIEGGRVTVTARDVDGRLHIEVADDGQGLDGPRRRGGNGVALDNIRARLQARFGASASLELLPRDGGGTRALIQFPLSRTAP
ncbi:MAG: histidine kinase [Pelomonas sp.]|nr:histidine kinase [Roseateles sp.]